MKLYDVSLPISENLPVWPGDPAISMSLSQSLRKGDETNVTYLGLSAHTGTHIDAPSHLEPEGIGIDQLPLDVLIGPCRLVDLSHLNVPIDRSLLEKLDLKDVNRILFKTRNSKLWENNDPAFHKDYVSLTTDGAEYLQESAIQLVGIDALSIEAFDQAGYPTHHLLLRNNVIILEGLNLHQVPAGDYELIALPLKLKGADGAPTGVVLRESSILSLKGEH